MPGEVQFRPFYEDGLLKGVGEYTWPGIELGHRPAPTHTFFEYVDALRAGDLELFEEIEKESGLWWHVNLDRGKGGCLHFAVESGQINAVRFLIEDRGAEINLVDSSRGQTALHRCSRMAHYTNKPYFEIFEYLLSKGADASLQATSNSQEGQLSVIDVAAHKGRGWQEGEVRAKLQQLLDKYAQVPKQPVYRHAGPLVGDGAQSLLDAWEALPVMIPPENWRPPPPAGFQGSKGVRLTISEAWRPAGDDDGSCYLRPMTDAELGAQSRSVQAAS